MAPAKRAGYKRERFLKYNKKVLRFYATWDDRKVHAARSPWKIDIISFLAE